MVTDQAEKELLESIRAFLENRREALNESIDALRITMQLNEGSPGIFHAKMAGWSGPTIT